MPEPKIRRVISDPLTKNRESRESDVLICEPDVPNRVKVSSASGIVRGDLIKIVMGESKGPIPRGGPSSAELESDADSE